MPRIKKPSKVKEPVRLRMKELANGNKSLYLDIYRNSKRSYEYLKLYIIPEIDHNARRQNQATMAAANAIKSKRIIQLTNGEAGIENREKVFLSDWMETYKENQAKRGEERRQSNQCYDPYPEGFCGRSGNDGSDRQDLLPKLSRLSADGIPSQRETGV